MASQITVTPKQLMERANELRNQNRTLKTQIESLRTQESSLSGMWEGQAREAFRTAFARDTAKMDEFYNTIEQYVNALEMIAAEYSRGENKNVGIASSK